MSASARTVLVVSHHGKIVGGGEISLLTLLKGLHRTNWLPVVVVPCQGAVAEHCEALGLRVHVIPLPTLRRPGPSTLGSIFALRNLIRSSAAALIHANGSRAMFYAGLAGRLARRPVIWHLRILEPDSSLDWLLVRLATATIATSQAVHQRLRRWPRAYEACTIVPNGLDLDDFRGTGNPRQLRDSLELAATDRVVITVGRLVGFKRQMLLLEAVALLRPRFPHIKCIIVGEGPEGTALESRAQRQDLAGAVIMAGHRDDIPDMLGISELFVLPSPAEHFGRVLLEAMAASLPVVAAAAAGPAEIVEDGGTGLLVNPEDPAALAEAMAKLLDDPQLARELGRSGCRRVHDLYSMHRHAELMERAFDALTFDPLGTRDR
ncbi:MAG: glycosyltransferase [Acidobacteriota bacterium]